MSKFKEKRQMQHEAVKRMLELPDKSKQKDMVKMVVNKLFEMLTASLKKLASLKNNSPEAMKFDQTLANGSLLLIIFLEFEQQPFHTKSK
jgi:hypothetical protein